MNRLKASIFVILGSFGCATSGERQVLHVEKSAYTAPVVVVIPVAIDRRGGEVEGASLSFDDVRLTLTLRRLEGDNWQAELNEEQLKEMYPGGRVRSRPATVVITRRASSGHIVIDNKLVKVVPAAGA